jgi:hypothetical protein
MALEYQVGGLLYHCLISITSNSSGKTKMHHETPRLSITLCPMANSFAMPDNGAGKGGRTTTVFPRRHSSL